MLSGPNRELSIVVAMLYWGEGSKKVCEFINSDGNMIQIYLRVIREILGVSEDRIRPTLRIFTGMSENKILNYWANVTRVPKSRFLVRLNDGGTKGNTQYGLCRITVRKGHYFLKLFHALIDQFFSSTVNQNICPRSSTDRTAHS